MRTPRPAPTLDRRTLLRGVATAAGGGAALLAFGPGAGADTPTDQTLLWRLSSDWGHPAGPKARTRCRGAACHHASPNRYFRTSEDAVAARLHPCCVAQPVAVAVCTTALDDLWSLGGTWNGVDVIDLRWPGAAAAMAAAIAGPCEPPTTTTTPPTTATTTTPSTTTPSTTAPSTTSTTAAPTTTSTTSTTAPPTTTAPAPTWAVTTAPPLFVGAEGATGSLGATPRRGRRTTAGSSGTSGSRAATGVAGAATGVADASGVRAPRGRSRRRAGTDATSTGTTPEALAVTGGDDRTGLVGLLLVLAGGAVSALRRASGESSPLR